MEIHYASVDITNIITRKIKGNILNITELTELMDEIAYCIADSLSIGQCIKSPPLPN